ncbi:MAG: murein L,D-transpeptidase [Verrucomicrobiaceae bacterium]|nr:MAG: murein L,D-transpeptidase [Verrucomicrobiaceae bacterium]
MPNPSPASTASPLKVATETPVAMMVPLPPDSELDTLLRMQIFLDEHNFGPGKLDGRMGEFGKKAASVYNQIHNIPIGDYGPLIASSQKANASIYTTYQVKDGDLAFVTPNLPGKPSEQAKTKYLGYRSLLEFVSERFHTSEEFLVKINPGRNLNVLKPGSVLKVPDVKPFELENWAKHVQFKPEPPGSGHAVVVDIRARVAIFFDDKNKPMASFPITPGEPRFIKFGEWKVTNMVSTPTFRWDKSMLEQGKRSSSYYELPLGPNNPVGIMWCGTSRSGIGLHGTNNPLTIGRAESHGCIRLANWDAVRLPGLLRPGARVIIR